MTGVFDIQFSTPGVINSTFPLVITYPTFALSYLTFAISCILPLSFIIFHHPLPLIFHHLFHYLLFSILFSIVFFLLFFISFFIYFSILFPLFIFTGLISFKPLFFLYFFAFSCSMFIPLSVVVSCCQSLSIVVYCCLLWTTSVYCGLRLSAMAVYG